ncbi:MAG: PaaI family thioesterase [bacterium]
MYKTKVFKNPGGFPSLLGLKFHEYQNGASRCSLKITGKHKNPNKVVHGGVLFSLADTGMGAALASLLKDNELCASIEIKMNFLLPVSGGTITANTRVVHKGSRIAVLESEIINKEGARIAVATGSFFIFLAPKNEK